MKRKTRPTKRKKLFSFKKILKQGAVASVILLFTLSGIALWKADLVHRLKNSVGDFFSSQTREKGFIVKDLIVEGRERADREEILKAIQVKKGDSILTLDLQEIQKKLLPLPWIRSVAVRRQLPDILYIKIAEHKPIALYQKNGKFSYITALGEHIDRPSKEVEKNLPVVTGEDAFRFFPKMREQVFSFPELKTKLTGAVFIGRRRWDLIFDQRLRVQLPEEGIHEALQRLVTLVKEQSIEDRNIIGIDLRYTDRMYLRLSPEAAKLHEDLNKIKLKKK